MNKRANQSMIIRTSQSKGFVRTNSSFLDDVGFTKEELEQKSFVEWIDEEDREIFQNTIKNNNEHCVVRHKTKEGGSLALDLKITYLGEGPVVLGRAAENMPTARLDSGATEDATVKSTLHTIAGIVEEQNPGYKCSILLVAHGRFVAGAGPSLPDDYNNAVDGYAIGPTVGSCGTAIYWNVPVIVEDIQNDPLWVDLAELAKTAGVASCWSHPFVSKGGRVLGALALYGSEPQAPTDEQFSRLRAAAAMTGLAVERGRAEEELRHANEVKARFMANMSHEIRTPLNALIGITDIVDDRNGPVPQSDIQLLRESSNQLLELFTGVLELTEARSLKGKEKVVEIAAHCRQLAELFEARAKAKDLSFKCVLLENLPQWISIDLWSFEHALGLLIDNALKFTQTGTVTLSVDCNDLNLRVRITDTGCGIDLERLSKLREPFVQGDLSTTKSYSGFGLGLALNDLYLDALGGELEFSENKPQGTEVSFTIPITLASAPAKVEERPIIRTRDASKLPVLVVEDNPVNSRVLAKALELSGYSYQLVDNGADAVEAYSKDNYCCILMDCQMPVMDGYEATRRIRELEQDSNDHISIIAVTANALAGDKDLCLEAGMDDYLEKPLRTSVLAGKLKEYVSSPSGIMH